MSGTSQAPPVPAPDARIAALERELAAARRTIEVLTDRQQRLEAGDHGAHATFQTMARLEDLVEERTRLLARSQREIQRYSDHLEELVVQRTEDLRASMERYQSLFDHAAEAIFTVDPEGKLTGANPEALRLTGLAAEAIQGADALKFVHRGDRRRLAEAWDQLQRSNTPLRTFPARVQLGDDRVVHVEFNAGVVRDADGEVVGLQVSARDVSVRVALQEALAATQRIETLGSLAAGVAHDFNNALAAMLPAVDRIQRDIGPQHDLHPYVQAIARATRHATGLTSQLLAFTRHGPTDSRVFDPVEALREAVALADALLPRGIAVRTALSPVAGVRMDPTRFEQVVLNLLVNAREAMGEQGTVTIHCEPVTLDRAAGAQLQPPLAEGTYVRVVVEDDGPGMDPEVAARAFELFFTTHPDTGGTGLGLAVVATVVEQAGGGLRVVSAPGRGARFEIVLPVAGEPDREASAETHGLPEANTVLVVEDDASLRRLVTELLREEGFEVVAVGDGDAAVELVRAGEPSFDVALLDLQLVHGSGGEVLAAIRVEHTELPVILTSGFVDADERRALLRDPHTRFLPKPYRIASLSAAIQHALASQGSSSPDR